MNKTSEKTQVKKSTRPTRKKSRAITRPRLTSKHLLQVYLADRKNILDFVNKQLVAGIDFGHAAYDNDGNPRGRKTLLKPGAEKICIHLQLDPVFPPDWETWSMLTGLSRPEGNGKMIESGFVVYHCFLLTKREKKKALELIVRHGRDNAVDIYRSLAIAEGRGARALEEVYKGKRNTTIKLAQKSGQIDATLRVEGLSEIFTQDPEDFLPEEIDRLKNGASYKEPAERNVTPKKDSFEKMALGDLFEKICTTLEKNPFGKKQREQLSKLAEQHFNGKQHERLVHLAKTVTVQAKQFKKRR